jgi:pimeloyl-ACP methyl ester carboxylesterase
MSGEIRHRFLASDGTALSVLEHGASDAMVTVVLIHGWTLSSRTWDDVARSLPKSTGFPVRTVRYDLRGHGESDPAPEGTATIEQCADDLRELINELVPEGPVVVSGHSMGGMTIMALAERHPSLFRQRVSGVALVSTSCGDLANPSYGLPRAVASVVNRGERLVWSRLALTRRGVVSARSHLLRPGLRWLLFGERPRRADVSATASCVAACHPATMASFRASLEQHDRASVLSRLRSVPTVVMSGLADRLTPHRHAMRIVAKLPEARLISYAGAGHMLPLERRDEVTAHLSRLARSARKPFSRNDIDDIDWLSASDKEVGA